jgi:hypothetical protein
MHYGTVIGGKNGPRVVHNRNRQFCLWATSICADTANSEVPLCHKAAERIARLICRTQDTNPRGGKLATLHLFNLGVHVGFIRGAALGLRRSPSSGIPRRHRIKVESKLQITRSGNLRRSLCGRRSRPSQRSPRRCGTHCSVRGNAILTGERW